MSDSTRCWNASPCLRPGLLTRARFPWPALGNLREEPSAGKPHARIRGGESRMAELPDHPHGVASGLIIQLGRQFTLRGLAPKKGPYAWFSRHMEASGPSPNWEYFVQVAEFVRLCTLAARSNLTVTFEDHLMDLAVYDGQRLLVCVEVKERTAQLQDLVKRLRTYEAAVNLSEPDRGNDPLRKAKYLVRRKPMYLCGVAIGTRIEYSVHYPEGKAFELARDVIPWV